MHMQINPVRKYIQTFLVIVPPSDNNDNNNSRKNANKKCVRTEISFRTVTNTDLSLSLKTTPYAYIDESEEKKIVRDYSLIILSTLSLSRSAKV